MDADSFLLLGAIVLVATMAVGFLGWPKPPPEKPKRPEPASRWAVFRLHPKILLEGGGTAAERLPDGPRLSAVVPYRAARPRVALVEGKSSRILIRRLWRPGRRVFRVEFDRRRLAELRPAKGGKAMPAIVTPGGNLSLHGSLREREFELRRAGKLIASSSPGIAPGPGSLGLEILAAEDPLPVLAVILAVALLAELEHPSRPAGPTEAAGGQAPAAVPRSAPAPIPMP